MSRYLMTHSLLQAWLYSMKSNSFEDAETERDSMAEFLQTLRREPIEPTPAMLDGIAFEDTVTAIVNSDKLTERLTEKQFEWYPAASQIANAVRGGIPQFKAKKEITVNGETFLLFGKLDWLRAGEITDIKFSKRYDRGKYFDSTQHPMYFEIVPEANTFVYRISNGNEVYTEAYRRDETPSIIPTIGNFVVYMKDTRLWQLYTEHWTAL